MLRAVLNDGGTLYAVAIGYLVPRYPPLEKVVMLSSSKTTLSKVTKIGNDLCPRL